MGNSFVATVAISSLNYGTRTEKSSNVMLWITQGLLALLFFFAGMARLTMPIQFLSSQTGLPGVFMLFIPLAEVIGALGLILPGLLHFRVGLTPFAAGGLVIIMVGAVISTILRQGVAPALFPFVVGCLLTWVIRARGRRVQIAGAR